MTQNYEAKNINKNWLERLSYEKQNGKELFFFVDKYKKGMKYTA